MSGDKSKKKDEYLYLKNIENINKFIWKAKGKKEYTAEFKALKENNKTDWIKLIINKGYIDGHKIYMDPDEFDEKLYKTINIKRKEKGLNEYEVHNGKFRDTNGIILSLDCVSGWKAIIDVYAENGKPIENFVNDYKIIRNPQYAGHLIWPGHKNSINQQRFRVFNDRVDYVLFDIKNYFENKETKIDYNKWLDSFENFDNFIEKMDLKRWCIEEKGKYKVINIENDGEITDYMPYNKGREDYPITKTYLENLIKKIQE